MIMNSEIVEPINLGSSEAVTTNQLLDIAGEIGGIRLKRKYNLDAPKGVNGRNSDNTLIKKLLNWEPNTPLRIGLEKTYKWIYDQYLAREKGGRSRSRNGGSSIGCKANSASFASKENPGLVVNGNISGTIQKRRDFPRWQPYRLCAVLRLDRLPGASTTRLQKTTQSSVARAQHHIPEMGGATST